MDQTFRFGRFRVSTERRELWAGDRRAPIGGRAFDILLVLLKRSGELVTKQDLVNEVWAGAAVEDNAIAAQISAIRRALGDTVADPGYVVTVPGRGYRLACAITSIGSAESPESPFLRQRRPSTWAVALLAIPIVAGAAVWAFHGSAPSTSSARDTRVAILPFDVVGSNQAARDLASGVADDLVGALSVSQIEAISRTESDTLRGPAGSQEIARLGISLLLGGLVRSEGESLRVRVHLDVAREHVTVWSAEFEGEAAAAGALQTEIAGQVAGVLACSRRASRPTRDLSDPVSLGRYIHACYSYSLGRVDSTEMNPILEDFRAIAAREPNSADAHGDVAENDALFLAGAPVDQQAALRSEAAIQANQALTLDAGSDAAYVSRSFLAAPSDWSERERLLRKAASVNPTWFESYAWLGLLLEQTGRLNEASVLLQKASAGELEYSFASAEAELLCETGKMDQGISALVAVRKVWPRSWVAWESLSRCFWWADRWGEARSLLRDASSRPPIDPALMAALDAVYAAQETHAATDLARARRLVLSLGRKAAPVAAIQLLTGVGLIEDAVTVAERSASSGTLGGNPAVLFYPSTAALRRDPRFIALAARIGLVGYWQTSGHWPDFCSQPDLPYDCRAEAARDALAGFAKVPASHPGHAG